MQQISQLQEYFPTDWTGLTTKTHLYSNMQIKPQDASEMTTLIYQTNFGNDLDTYLNKFPVLRLKTDDEFRWALQGNSTKNIPLVSCSISGSAITAASKTGQGKARFTLTFPEAFFHEMDLIVGEKNELYPIRIVEGPRANGMYYDYECELFGKDLTKFIPYDELVAGKLFSFEWAPVEKTLSKKGTEPTYTSPFTLLNNFTNIRMQCTYPGNMRRRPVAFSWVVRNTTTGKSEVKTTWMDYADWEFEKQFRDMYNRMIMFATSNKADTGTGQIYYDLGKTGWAIEQGAGLREQMYSANTYYYNTFNIRWLTNVIMDMSVGKLRQDQRAIALRTGEWGMAQFHFALQDYASLYTPLFDTSRVYMKGNDVMGFKGQFLDYRGPNGIHVSLQHEPLYDDNVRNKVIHSSGYGVAESYRYDVFNVGQIEGEYNVRKVVHEDFEDIRAYVPGMRDPFTPDGKGPNTNKMIVDPVDGWTIHRMREGGAMIKDPTKTVQILPNELA